MAKTGRMKPCRGCSALFYCNPARDVGGTQEEKKFCTNACFRAYRATPEGIADRFWSKVEKSDGCWLFKGCIGHEGYGSFAYGDGPQRKQFQAHRFAWILTNGSIPGDKLLLHHCDVRDCVNPDHLYLGTRVDNIQDAIKRGRYHHRYTPVEKLLWPQLSRRLNPKPNTPRDASEPSKQP